MVQHTTTAHMSFISSSANRPVFYSMPHHDIGDLFDFSIFFHTCVQERHHILLTKSTSQISSTLPLLPVLTSLPFTQDPARIGSQSKIRIFCLLLCPEYCVCSAPIDGILQTATFFNHLLCVCSLPSCPSPYKCMATGRSAHCLQSHARMLILTGEPTPHLFVAFLLPLISIAFLCFFPWLLSYG